MMSSIPSEVPANVAEQMPPRSLVMDVMASSVCTLRRGTLLSRAAWSAASAIPEFVTQTYRWGPPASSRHAIGRFPFYWLYVAEDIHTAIWEGRFCEKVQRYPGFFKFNNGAEDGLLVNLRLEADLKLFEIGGQTAARLGIYDQLSDPDHRWCKYFGLEMHHVMSALFDETGAIGIRYPSRRLRNYSAIAIHSSHLARWKKSVTIETARFGDLPVYRELFNDPCRLNAAS
jgi:hypothetical protein